MIIISYFLLSTCMLIHLFTGGFYGRVRNLWNNIFRRIWRLERDCCLALLLKPKEALNLLLIMLASELCSEFLTHLLELLMKGKPSFDWWMLLQIQSWKYTLEWRQLPLDYISLKLRVRNWGHSWWLRKIWRLVSYQQLFEDNLFQWELQRIEPNLWSKMSIIQELD